MKLSAVLLAGGAFFLAFAVAFAINRMKVGDSATFIALLLTPLLVYGVAIGLATYLSYLLLTEFDGAARAFEGSRQRALSQTLEF